MVLREYAKWGEGAARFVKRKVAAAIEPASALDLRFTEPSRRYENSNSSAMPAPDRRRALRLSREKGEAVLLFSSARAPRGTKRKAEQARQRWFESVALDDANAVQKALTQVMQRLASGQIEHKNAGQILYKLQIASMNLRKVSLDP